MKTELISALAAGIVILSAIAGFSVMIDSFVTENDLKIHTIEMKIHITSEQIKLLVAQQDLGQKLSPVQVAVKHQLELELDSLLEQRKLLAPHK